jgi:hypothetical protein
MCENMCQSKTRFKIIKSVMLCVAENKRNMFLGQACKWNSNIREVINEPMLEIGKAKE